MQTAAAKKQSASGALTITPTFGAATTPGNTLVLLVMPGGTLGSVTTSVTDNGTSGTNVWVKVFDFVDTDQAQLWACLNPVESITSVTLTFSSSVGGGVIAIAIAEDAQYTIPSTTLGTDWNKAYYKGSINPVPVTAPITTAAATVQVRSGFNNRTATAGTPNNYTFITSLAQTSGTVWSVALSGTSVTGIGTVTTESWTSGVSNTDTLTLTWQLVPAGGATGTATFSGTGTLTTTGTPHIPGTVTLSGTGTLTASGTPHIPGTVTLSGTGTLTASGTPHIPGTVTLSGTGTLTASGTPHITKAVALSGTGTLTASGTPHPVGTVALAGSGTLNAQAASGTVTLSGTGTLHAVGRNPHAASAWLYGPPLAGAYHSHIG